MQCMLRVCKHIVEHLRSSNNVLLNNDDAPPNYCMRTSENPPVALRLWVTDFTQGMAPKGNVIFDLTSHAP